MRFARNRAGEAREVALRVLHRALVVGGMLRAGLRVDLAFEPRVASRDVARLWKTFPQPQW